MTSASPKDYDYPNPVKLTTKERRALREFAERGTSSAHANTRHALQRKGMLGRRNRVTAAGRAALAVPDVFEDLFPKPVPVDPDRALAAAEVLAAVWLADTQFELEHKISDPPVAEQDAEGHVWVTVKLHVPALDIDCWLDGTHLDHPDNQGEETSP